MDFADAVNRVLKYSDRSIDPTNHEALETGLNMLASPEHTATRIGGTKESDQVFRNRLSDLLRDHGRDQEADMLADPKRRIHVRHGVVTDALKEAVFRGKAEINSDIRRGIVPSDVSDFSTLHDYVDANEYGGAFDDQEGFGHDSDRVRDRVFDFWNGVQDELHRWLQNGRPENPTVGPDDIDHNRTKL